MTSHRSRPGEPGRRGARDAQWWGTESVTVKYGGKVALDGVSFRAEPGQVSVVVGGDGSGRTTLLRCLAGALAPSGGQVRRPPARRIGYMPASAGVYPDLSVAENLSFRAAAFGVPAAQAAERTAEFLGRAGLADVRGRLAGRLSGGMRQKLGVIAALLPKPDLLILDEPTTGVDPVSRADLWWLIARAAADGAAIVIATSYLDEAERASQVLALDAGRVLAQGTPDEIVGAIPGTLLVSDKRPSGDARRRSWRRERRWRVWQPADGPAGGGAAGGDRVEPDLQDGVTVAELARELAGPAGGEEGER
jgi:ABC-2 type transport system ATP-binding protein